jgi:hypothetical protein
MSESKIIWSNVEDKLVLQVQVSGRELKHKNILNILVIDVSGSMAGSRVNSINQLLTTLRQRPDVDKFYVITYNHQAQAIQPLQSLNLPLYANGGTDFQPAIKEMSKVLSSRDFAGQELSFSFMTDGDHDISLGTMSQVDKVWNLFHALCVTRAQAVTVHTISYGNATSQTYLESLINTGKNKGTFRFASTSGEVSIKFEDIFDLSSHSIGAQLKWNNQCIPVTLTSLGTNMDTMDHESKVNSVSEQNVVWEGIVLETPVAAEVQAQLSAQPVLLEVRGTTLHLPYIYSSPTSYLKLKYWEAFSIQSEADVKKIMTGLASVVIKGGTWTEKMQMEQIRREINARLLSYLEIFNQIRTQTLSQTEAALKLGELRYQVQFDKSRRNRVMAVRVNENSERMKDMDTRLQNLSREITAQEWEEIKSLADTYTCIMTQRNLGEIMQEDQHDFLCWGIFIEERPSVIVDNPSCGLRVKSLSSTLISFSSFAQAMAKAIAEKGDLNAHGGFAEVKSVQHRDVHDDRFYHGDKPVDDADDDSTGAYCLVGQAREKVNAVIPCNLHPAHLRRVMTMLPYWCGYLYTLDTLGYNKNQEVALMALLGKMLTMKSLTEADHFYTRMIQDFATLCREITAHSANFVQAWPRYRLDNFINQVYGRRKELVPNLLTVVGMEYAQMSTLRPELVRAVYWESVKRRVMSDYNGDKMAAQDMVKKLLFGLEYHQAKDRYLQAHNTSEQKELAQQARLALQKEVEQKFADWWESDSKDTPELPLFVSQHDLDPTLYLLKPAVDSLADSVVQLTRELQEKYTEPIFLQQIRAHLQLPPLIFTPGEVWLNFLHDFHFYNDYSETVRLDQIVDVTYDVCLNDAKSRTLHHTKDERDHYITQWIVNAEQDEAFAAMLVRYCPTRSGIIFDAVINELIRQGHKKRLIMIMSNRLPHDNSSRHCLYNNALKDVVWIPRGIPQLRVLTDILGAAKLSEIEQYNQKRAPYKCTHMYRASNKPNRHGYSNESPNPKFVCNFISYEKSCTL